MKSTLIFLTSSLSLLLSFACHSDETCIDQKPVVEKVLTKEQQDKLTPSMVLNELKQGNQRFINGTLTVRNHNKQVRKSALGQYPKAIVLGCVDSRVPVEDVFDRGIGDLFVARVAGNFVNEDILGSIEFATKVAGAKLIVVLGHDHCGAVKAAIDNVELGNITSLVKHIQPAVKMTSNFEGKKSTKNPKYVHEVCTNNVANAVKQISLRSPIIKKLVSEGKVGVIGAVYDMNTGKVSFLE